ncbi:MAG TPA: ABC transporter permease [Tepidiformaceae bacterium]|nr:ABC transporter permease [Tepidiformaceae bacterium]HSE44239.1 ABC transporter permease [Gemmatimonadales bacterium]
MAQSQTQTLEIPFEDVRGPRLPFYLDVLRRLVREKPLGLVGALLVLMFFVMAVAAPLIAPYGKNELGAGPRLEGPTLSHLFGTDNLGRDVFSRVVFGAQVSMTIGFVAVTMATLISVLVGVLSGYFTGIVDMLSQRIVDAFIAFPGLVFIIAVSAIFVGYDIPGLPKDGVLQTENVVLMGTIGVLLGVGSSRIIRSATLSVKSQPYMEASRALGASHRRMIFVHVLPNVLPPAITLATLGLGTAILLESSLSFLGLGVPPNTPTWGGMLNREARTFMSKSPWLALFPGLALSLAVFGFNMLGDALRDLLDPRLRTS